MRVLEPRRASYKKKIDKFKICEFCNKKNIESQECRSLSNARWMVFVNKYPYIDGNLMIIPKRHVENLEDLKASEWRDFEKVLLKTKRKLGKIFDTKDFNIGINLGKNAGSSIEHIHWQIFPRKYGLQNSANILADLHIIAIKPEKLKKMIEK